MTTCLPLDAGIGDTGGKLYTLNATGHAIWRRLDGQHSLREVVSELVAEYSDAENEIGRDVLGLVRECQPLDAERDKPDAGRVGTVTPF